MYGIITEIIRLAKQHTDRTDVVIRTNVEFKKSLRDDGDPLVDKIGKGEWHLFDSSDPTREFGRMIANYANTGRRQKIVINVNDFQVGDEADLKKKRRKLINDINSCYENAIRAYDLGGGKNARPKNKIYEIVGFSAATNAEMDSGRHVIPTDEAIKCSVTKPVQTTTKIAKSKKINNNKMNDVLNIED